MGGEHIWLANKVSVRGQHGSVSFSPFCGQIALLTSATLQKWTSAKGRLDQENWDGGVPYLPQMLTLIIGLMIAFCFLLFLVSRDNLVLFFTIIASNFCNFFLRQKLPFQNKQTTSQHHLYWTNVDLNRPSPAVMQSHLRVLLKYRFWCQYFWVELGTCAFLPNFSDAAFVGAWTA